MVKVENKPADLGRSGWEAILPERRPQSALKEDVNCDYLVVGAGFAGLAAARRLRQLDPYARIVMLEAREVACGPSGRNSGFLIDLPHSLTSGSYVSDDSTDQRNIRLNRAAIEFAAELAHSHGFGEDAFARRGKINAAASSGGLRHNRAYARHLEHLGESFEMLDAKDMQSVCGSGYYRGGLRTPGTAIIQPALFVRRFAETLQREDRVELYENTAVVEMARDGDRWTLRSQQGSVCAERVILAVNGLIESFGFYRQRLMHINLYGSMTRALADDEIESLGGIANWGFTPADPLGSTVRRLDADDGGTRIVMRNRCTYEATLSLPADRLQAIAHDHRRTFDARFPMLQHVDMEFCWSGRLCLSRNESWALGELQPGLFSACCQNGLGATRGLVAGIVAAEMACPRSVESLVPDYRPQQPPSKLLPEPFMTLGARGVIRLREWRAGREL